MALFLGVDGGQSSTRAVIGDATGKVVGRGSAGPSNHAGAEQGRVKLTAAVSLAVGKALAEAAGRWGETRFAAACFGMSGGPDDKREILAELIAADRLEVVSDAEVALAGATGGAPGVVVIAGTGSMALARDAEGRTARAGGWGYLFGDEGGAFDIVRQALRAILRAEEGWGPPTTLRENLLTAGSAAGANELMHLFYTAAWPRERIAALAPLVEDAAEAGDEVARRILADAGGALAGLARSARGRLFSVQDAVPIAPAGGVFESRAVRQSFEADLGAENVIEPCYPADVGALLCAYRAAGVEIPALEG